MTTINPDGHHEKVTIGHEDIEEIPEGVELPSSEGSLIEDEETPDESDDYSDIDVDHTIEEEN